MSLFHWSEETINYFKFISSYLTKEQTIRKIELFVEMDCIPAEEETEDMLVQDLVNVIYKQKVKNKTILLLDNINVNNK